MATVTSKEAQNLLKDDILEKALINRRPCRPAKKRPGRQWSPQTDDFRPFIHIDIQTGRKYLFHWPLTDSGDEWPSAREIREGQKVMRCKRPQKSKTTS